MDTDEPQPKRAKRSAAANGDMLDVSQQPAAAEAGPSQSPQDDPNESSTAARGQVGEADALNASTKEPTKGSSPPSAEAIPAKAGIGARLLAKMGYQSGQGLGRDSQGRVEPVKIEQRGGEGLGYTNHELLEVNRGIVDSPWFERDDGRADRAFLDLPPLRHLHEQDMPKSALVVARRLQMLNSSKFCRRQILEDLHLARLERLPEVLRRLQHLDMEAREAIQATCGIAAPSITRAFSNRHTGVEVHLASQELLLAQVEQLGDVLPTAAQVRGLSQLYSSDLLAGKAEEGHILV